MKNLLFTIVYTVTCIFSLSGQGNWTQKADFPGGSLSGLTTFTIQGKGYVVGGINNLSNAYVASLWEYNPVSDSWSQKADLPGGARAYGLGFSIDNKGYCGGGVNDANTFSDFWQYDPATDTWTQRSDLPGPGRVGGVSFSIGNKGYMGTGLDYQNIQSLADFWEYDPVTDAWSQKADINGDPRFGAAAFAVASGGYICGGYSLENDSYLNDLMIYDPVADSWSSGTVFPGAIRELPAVFTKDSKSYICGGYNVDTDQYLNDLWEYDPTSDSWTQAEDFAGQGRGEAAGIGILGSGFIIGGHDEDDAFQDVWKYTTNTGSNQPPVADAGADITIRLPENTVQLNGSGTDTDGTIVSYEWTPDPANPAPATFSDFTLPDPVVSNLIEGVYIFTLTVTDDQGAVGSDQVTVTVNPANQPPVVIAGEDITIHLPDNSVQLAGTAFDPDGSVVSFTWSQDPGNPAPAAFSDFSIPNPTVGGLIEGIYTFTLKAVDNEGAAGYDDVHVIVLPPVNLPPVAHVGYDLRVVLPEDSIRLNGTGTDPEGGPITFYWKQIGNLPSVATISDPTSPDPLLSDLILGVYTLRLIVTDDNGLSDSVDQNVIVDIVGNIRPVANAGEDATILIPQTSYQLSGSGTDSDGYIVGYTWEQVGDTPNTAIISNPNISNPIVSGLIRGAYTFRLTVTDNEGSEGKDEMTLIVFDTFNIAPIANAGPDATIALPQNTYQLHGSGSDADGSIISYQWQQVGDTPSQAVFSDSHIPNPIVSNLIYGHYTFRLTVKDDYGATGSDDVVIFVRDSFNHKPIANAGGNIHVTLPTNSAQLHGTGHDDDGVIVGYEWQQLGNTPNTAVISNPDIANPIIGGFIYGTYTFIFTVRDNEFATGSDTIQIVVDTIPLKAPVADAGFDLFINLPQDSVQLHGNGTDEDGTVVAYGWKQIGSQPSIAEFSDSNIADPIVRSLVEGTYVFVLTVTDNDGLKGSDTMHVIVNRLANIPPVANAGPDITIKLPTDATVLHGSGSDVDGTIISYVWEQVGTTPDIATIIGNNSPEPTVSNLVKGTYTFRLIVTDDMGAKDTDEVSVFVLDELSTHTEDISSAIYPNPAKGGMFYINPGDKIKPGTPARIIDMNGREMMRFVVGRENKLYRCDQCGTGVFVIRFDNGMWARLIIMP